MLDGWRALSILAVLAGHFLPLGPKSWQLNSAVPATGMALFFALSGFLIVQLLLRDDRVYPFLIRRLFRIVPLAWGAMLVLAIAWSENWRFLSANLGFYANLPPAQLMRGGHPLWSLCIEVQFYAFVACLTALAGRRGLYVLPLAGLAVTAWRIHAGVPISIYTWERIDEIMAGAALGLIVYHIGLGQGSPRIPAWTPLVLGALLLASGHPALPWLNYARPYLAAAAIGTSLYGAPAWMQRLWVSAPARYVAEISYALYVLHGVLAATWLGGADASKSVRYALRPLLLAATFALAHLSTFHYEKRWIALGRRLAKRGANPASMPATAPPQAPGQP